MRKLNQSASSILRTLTAGLAIGAARKLGTDGDTYQPVCVDRLSERTFSVAHYYEQNGDLCADPDVVFLLGVDGAFYPLSITQAAIGRHASYVELDDDETPVRYSKAGQADLAHFCCTWMENIRHQQGVSRTRA